MAKVGVLQCASGIAGDMLLGALTGAGADFQAMRRSVREATAEQADLEAVTVRKQGLSATQVKVLVEGQPLDSDPGHLDQHGVTWKSIDARLEQSPLAPPLQKRARSVFRRLAEAEARVHGAGLDTVHFHELGGIDAVADIVGSLAGLDSLGLEDLYIESLNVGGGTVNTSHGRLPVPAPATLELLQGIPFNLESEGGEWVTPTGAVLLRECAQPLPPDLMFTPERTGMGAGTRDLPGQPNVLRLLLGTSESKARVTRVGVVESTLDDCTPEDMGYLIQHFMDQGVLDATVSSVWMKKGRPGFRLELIVPPQDAQEWARRVVEQSSSLGARWRVESRFELERRVDQVEIDGETVRVKVAVLPHGEERPHAEFADLERLARATGRPLDSLRRRVEQAWMARK